MSSVHLDLRHFVVTITALEAATKFSSATIVQPCKMGVLRVGLTANQDGKKRNQGTRHDLSAWPWIRMTDNLRLNHTTGEQ